MTKQDRNFPPRHEIKVPTKRSKSLSRTVQLAGIILVSAVLGFGASTGITLQRTATQSKTNTDLLTRLTRDEARLDELVHNLAAERKRVDRRLCRAVQADRGLLRAVLRAARSIQRQAGALPPPTAAFFRLAIAKAGPLDCQHPGAMTFHLTPKARVELRRAKRFSRSLPSNPPPIGSSPTFKPRGHQPRQEQPARPLTPSPAPPRPSPAPQTPSRAPAPPQTPAQPPSPPVAPPVPPQVCTPAVGPLPPICL